LESGIQLKETGIPLTIGIQNPRLILPYMGRKGAICTGSSGFISGVPRVTIISLKRCIFFVFVVPTDLREKTD